MINQLPNASEASKKRRATWLVLELVVCMAVGAAMCLGMRWSSFDVQTWILLAIAPVLFVTTLVMPWLQSRNLIPLSIISPCTFYVATYCGDIGPVHFMDSVPFLFGAFAFNLMLFSQFTWRTMKRLWKREQIVFSYPAANKGSRNLK
jgi:hypothetical protein